MADRVPILAPCMVKHVCQDKVRGFNDGLRMFRERIGCGVEVIKGMLLPDVIIVPSKTAEKQDGQQDRKRLQWPFATIPNGGGRGELRSKGAHSFRPTSHGAPSRGQVASFADPVSSRALDRIALGNGNRTDITSSCGGCSGWAGRRFRQRRSASASIFRPWPHLVTVWPDPPNAWIPRCMGPGHNGGGGRGKTRRHLVLAALAEMPRGYSAAILEAGRSVEYRR